MIESDDISDESIGRQEEKEKNKTKLLGELFLDELGNISPNCFVSFMNEVQTYVIDKYVEGKNLVEKLNHAKQSLEKNPGLKEIYTRHFIQTIGYYVFVNLKKSGNNIPYDDISSLRSLISKQAERISALNIEQLKALVINIFKTSEKDYAGYYHNLMSQCAHIFNCFGRKTYDEEHTTRKRYPYIAKAASYEPDTFFPSDIIKPQKFHSYSPGRHPYFVKKLIPKQLPSIRDLAETEFFGSTSTVDVIMRLILGKHKLENFGLFLGIRRLKKYYNSLIEFISSPVLCQELPNFQISRSVELKYYWDIDQKQYVSYPFIEDLSFKKQKDFADRSLELFFSITQSNSYLRHLAHISQTMDRVQVDYVLKFFEDLTGESFSKLSPSQMLCFQSNKAYLSHCKPVETISCMPNLITWLKKVYPNTSLMQLFDFCQKNPNSCSAYLASDSSSDTDTLYIELKNQIVVAVDVCVKSKVEKELHAVFYEDQEKDNRTILGKSSFYPLTEITVNTTKDGVLYSEGEPSVIRTIRSSVDRKMTICDGWERLFQKQNISDSEKKFFLDLCVHSIIDISRSINSCKGDFPKLLSLLSDKFAFKELYHHDIEQINQSYRPKKDLEQFPIVNCTDKSSPFPFKQDFYNACAYSQIIQSVSDTTIKTLTLPQFVNRLDRGSLKSLTPSVLSNLGISYREMSKDFYGSYLFKIITLTMKDDIDISSIDQELQFLNDKETRPLLDSENALIGFDDKISKLHEEMLKGTREYGSLLDSLTYVLINCPLSKLDNIMTMKMTFGQYKSAIKDKLIKIFDFFSREFLLNLTKEYITPANNIKNKYLVAGFKDYARVFYLLKNKLQIHELQSIMEKTVDTMRRTITYEKVFIKGVKQHLIEIPKELSEMTEPTLLDAPCRAILEYTALTHTQINDVRNSLLIIRHLKSLFSNDDKTCLIYGQLYEQTPDLAYAYIQALHKHNILGQYIRLLDQVGILFSSSEVKKVLISWFHHYNKSLIHSAARNIQLFKDCGLVDYILEKEFHFERNNSDEEDSFVQELIEKAPELYNGVKDYILHYSENRHLIKLKQLNSF